MGQLRGIDMELLREHHEGLIALSGCVGGYIPQLILAGTLSDAEKYAERHIITKITT